MPSLPLPCSRNTGQGSTRRTILPAHDHDHVVVVVVVVVDGDGDYEFKRSEASK